jgi:hypothetical protein
LPICGCRFQRPRPVECRRWHRLQRSTYRHRIGSSPLPVQISGAIGGSADIPAASGAGHSPNAAFTALLSQHRMLLGVPFALHTEPHAKRSEIKSHKVQIQNQLHNATFRQKGIYAPKRGFPGPSIGRCAPRGTKEMRLGVNAAATFGLHIGPSGLFVARL